MEVQPTDEDIFYHDKEGTALDSNDMRRMGKVQELKVWLLSRLLCVEPPSHILKQRNLRPMAALSFASVLQATWEFLLM